MSTERGEDQERGEPASQGVERDWKVAHEQLLRLARRRAGLDLDEGRWLLVAFRTGAHVRLGHGSFAEYVERVLGYAPRLTHEKLRVAEALETLRAVPQALREGKLSWSAARELTRVATTQTEGEWLAAARGRTVRDVERLVSGHGFGSRPQDPVDPQMRRHVMRFEVGGETLAAFRDALARIRREAGGPLDDDAALLLMARHVLGGPKDEGRASYQLAMTVCEDCRRARQHAHGELVDVAPEVIEMARCDAQHLDSASTHVGRDETGTSTHAGRENRPQTRRRRGARQDVPPAVRRFVLRRDQGRCVFPGCRHATFVDIHHIEHKASGGDHHPDNLVTVCGAHHRAIHRGDVILEGSVSTGLRFRHADGSEYGLGLGLASEADFGAARDAELQARHEPEGTRKPEPGLEAEASPGPSAAKLRASCYRALRRMGFGEVEAREALNSALTHVGQKPTLEQLIRQALRALTGDLARAS